VLELKLISFGWVHSFQLIFWQVIGAIGVAMMALSALLFLPRSVMIVIAVVLVAGQDVYNLAVDWFRPDHLPLWRFLQGGMWRPHPGVVSQWGFQVLLIYPVLPWIGVLTLGYAAGGLMHGEPNQRRARFLNLGSCFVVAFLVLRGIDGFGNVRSFWGGQASSGPGWMAFLACEEYPPSLLLAAEAGLRPLPEGFVGTDLFTVYLFTAICVAVLYPLCRWFGERKRRSRSVWLSYL
jgi:uncharacterized membrane protein